MKFLKIIFFSVALLVLQFCKTSENVPRSTGTQTIKVAAAANLRFVLEDLKKDFISKNPNYRIEIVFGSSGTLTQQIINGADFDLFLSANTKFPATLDNKGLAMSKPSVYTRGKIALWSMNIDVSKGLKVLENKSINKIAVANPELAPYGRNIVVALEKIGAYESLKSKSVWGENISQTAQFVSSGNADIGFVALSTVLAPEMIGKGNYYVLTSQEASPIEQGGVILKSGNQDYTSKFYSYITSEIAKPIWAKYGYENN